MASRLIALLLLLTAPVVLGACGGEHEPKRDATGNPADPAGTEGAYLSLEPLTYQVQISRQLNPRDIEDKAYLEGVLPSRAGLERDETWFGVFMRVANEGENVGLAASRFRITDTEDNVFQPIPIAGNNPFAYRAIPMEPKQLLPNPDSVAGQGTIVGSLVLFKLRYSTLQNRPLVLQITDPRGREARVNLDV